MELMFTSAVADNETLASLLRQLKALLLLGNAWYPRNSVPAFVDKRYELHEYSLESLTQELTDFRKHWDEQQAKQLNTWDLRVLAVNLQEELSSNDQVKTELHELKLMFAEVERNLKAECERLAAECAIRGKELDDARAEAEDALQIINRRNEELLQKSHAQEVLTLAAEEKRDVARTANVPMEEKVKALQLQVNALKIAQQAADDDKAVFDALKKKIEGEIAGFKKAKADWETELKTLRAEETQLKTSVDAETKKAQEGTKRVEEQEAQIKKSKSEEATNSANILKEEQTHRDNAPKIAELVKQHDALLEKKKGGCLIL
jgi:chromosome segregation ATPase